MKSFYLLFSLIFTFAKCSVKNKNSPTIGISTGLIEGVRFEAEFGGEKRFWQEYRGIRYAEKPTRFNIPIPARSHTGVYDTPGLNFIIFFKFFL